ncbi:30S ribosomal protein S4 [Candidatus Uhrbacteria bacterium]|nr:30S ribosomal protein S4 [Candidatus Uhrbacteria bacterium]
MGKFPLKEKLERREGVHLHVKGERCTSPKCGVTRRNYPPGVHGPKGRPRLTPYGVQLREKQKVKRFYGLLERQFRRYFDAATSRRGDTGLFLMQTLERRLDNVVYRMGFAKSRRQARQVVNHGHFLVNGTLVNIPSYSVRIGDVVTLKESKRSSGLYADLLERWQQLEVPPWLIITPDEYQGKVLALPEGVELKQTFDPRLIVEFYSR